MTDKVVINFTEQGLQDIVGDLLKVGLISEKQATDFKKSNEDYKARQALVSNLATAQSKVSTETSKSAGSMDAFAKAAASASATIVNGATNTTIKKTSELIDQNIAGTKEYDNSLRGLKQQYKDLVAQAIEVGENSPFGKQYLKEAGEVKDRIADIQKTTKSFGSDTATFDAIGQGIRGIGAGFQIAQGSQALFGDGSKDLEKQLVKIQATMALVSGLTEVQNALQHESALRVGLTNAQVFIENNLARIGITFKTQSNTVDAAGEAIKERVIVVQAIENGLQSESVIVRGAATAAQWLLNAAMYAFPLLAIIAGLAVVIGLFGGFGDSINKAAEMQIKLNAIQKANLEVAKAQSDLLNKSASERETSIQRDIDLLVAQKASTDQIRAKEAELARDRTRNATLQKEQHAQEIADLAENRIAVLYLSGELAGLNKQKALKNNTDAFDNRIEAIKGQLENLNELISVGETAKKNAAEASLAITTLVSKQQNEKALEGLTIQKDVISAKLRFAKEGSDMQLTLMLSAAKNERDIAIANLTASNESRADIEAAYREKELDLTIAYNNNKLQKKADNVNAELQKVRIGSAEEIQLKLQALDYANQIEINNRKITDEKKRMLVAKFIKDSQDLIYAGAKKLTDDQINMQLLINDAQLQAVEKTVTSELQLKQQQLALQEQLELNNIDKNIQGTALGEATKADIIAKYTEKNRLLQVENTGYIINQREEESKRLSDVFQKQSDIEAANVNTTTQRKQQLQLEAFDNKITALEKEKNADTDLYRNKVINYTEYKKKLAAIDDEEGLIRAEKQNAIDAQERENLLRKVDQANQIATDALNSATLIVQSGLDIQTAAYDKETKANETLHNEKKETDLQYEQNKIAIDKRMADAKKKAAIADKDIALFQIAINTAQAAIKAFTYADPITAAIESALIVAFGAIQYATTVAKPIPEFAKGTKDAPKGWAWVGEKGPELIWMKGGEEVKTHDDSIKFARQKYTPALVHTFSDKIDSSPIPSKRVEEAMAAIASQNPAIDINVLSKLIGNEFGSHLGKMPLTLMSFDKNGFSASVRQGNSTTKFMDSRYSS
jgi:hypothetical protein